jgi:hypothetical protein
MKIVLELLNLWVVRDFFLNLNYLQNPSNVFDIVYMLIGIHVTPSWLHEHKIPGINKQNHLETK